MPSFEIQIPIIPKAQKRHRARIAGNKTTGRQWVHTYKDAGARNDESNLRSMIHRALPNEFLYPIQTAISLQVFVAFPVPPSYSKKERERMISGETRHTKAPDADNLAKSLLDCMKGILFVDDKQVWFLCIEKGYSENPRWEVRVRW